MEDYDKSVRTAATAVGRALQGTKYAIVGGAACAILGSTRSTLDVDVVVPRGRTKAARLALRSNPSFRVEPRTLHTTYLDDIPIDILTPPALFKGEFNDDTPTLEIDGTHVLKPTLLLNCKCASICERPNEEGKMKDSHSIQFLLQWCAENGCLLGAKEGYEVPNATKEFVDWFVAEFGLRSLWEEAGFDFD